MDADQPNSQQLNPAALTPTDAARLLTAAGGRYLPREAVQSTRLHRRPLGLVCLLPSVDLGCYYVQGLFSAIWGAFQLRCCAFQGGRHVPIRIASYQFSVSEGYRV